MTAAFRPLLLSALFAFSAFGPWRALAHPHIFVDATIDVVFDAEGRAEALRIGWSYDAFFSMTWLAENGFDPDFDGVLTPEEEARLIGFDMEWDADFPGDTYALVADAPVPLSRPEAPTATVQEGRLVSSHLRRLAAPVDARADDLVVQVYDPSFYTAYTIAAPPVLTGGAECRAVVHAPDRAAADARLQAALVELAGTADAEIDFPAIGSAYAEEARISCGPN